MRSTEPVVTTLSLHALDSARKLDDRAEASDVLRWWEQGEAIEPGLVWQITQRKGIPSSADRFRLVRGLPGMIVVSGHTIITVLRMQPSQMEILRPDAVEPDDELVAAFAAQGLAIKLVVLNLRNNKSCWAMTVHDLSIEVRKRPDGYQLTVRPEEGPMSIMFWLQPVICAQLARFLIAMAANTGARRIDALPPHEPFDWRAAVSLPIPPRPS